MMRPIFEYVAHLGLIKTIYVLLKKSKMLREWEPQLNSRLIKR